MERDAALVRQASEGRSWDLGGEGSLERSLPGLMVEPIEQKTCSHDDI